MAAYAATAQVIPFPNQRGPGSPANDEGPRRPLERLRRQFTDDVAAKVNENTEAADAEKYFHGVQWTQEQLKLLDARNQPPVTFNRIKRKVNTVMGILEKLRQAPKAYGRTPAVAAQQGADLATNVLRYALGWDWSDLSAEVGKSTAKRGICGAEIVLVPGDKGDPEVEWDIVDQRDFFYDARSTKPDFTDARRMGTTRWWDIDEVIETWPDSEEEIQNYVETGPRTDWERGDDRTRLAWINSTDKQLRIVDHWYMVGSEWHYAIYCGNVMLEFGESPHRDEKGRSVSKFEMMSYDVDQDGDRYSIYRDLKGPQDEVNHRRSKALHTLNSRRVIADDGAVDDVEVARREYGRSDGWVVKKKGYELLPDDADKAAVVQGNLEMLQEAKAEIDTYGPNPGLIGTEIPAESGRAIQLLQAAGIAELGTFIRVYKNWKLRVYRKTWCAVQRFWVSDRWIRVTDNPQMEQFIQINGWEKDELGYPVAINQLAALDVDIMIDEGRDSVTTMADIFDTLLGLAKSGSPIPPEALIEVADLPPETKAAVLAKLQPKPQEQQAMMMKLGELEQTIRVLATKADLQTAQAQKAMAEAAQPPEGPQQQVDTPADMAKARLDHAKATEIEQKVAYGANLPQPQPVEPQQPGLFEVNLAKAREHDARAALAGAQIGASEAQRIKTLVEARTIDEAPPGMLTKPPPRPPAAKPNPAR